MQDFPTASPPTITIRTRRGLKKRSLTLYSDRDNYEGKVADEENQGTSSLNFEYEPAVERGRK
jgi:hypothetical protein